MDSEMDLMLSKKSYVMETGKQEELLQQNMNQTKTKEEIGAEELKLGQVMNMTSHKKKVSLEQIEKSLMEEPGNMDAIRQKGRVFMKRYEARKRLHGFPG